MFQKVKPIALFCFLVFVFAQGSFAQFAPQAGMPGSTALAADYTGFANWASGFTISRGWQNIADTSLGKVNVGEEWSITGKAGNGVISLGDGGSITLTFPFPIRNGSGPDFAVFENGFLVNDSMAFLELAFVEVSSNGSRFVRFPATCLAPDTAASFLVTNARHLNNLAGKYIGGYGTPFDLQELIDSPGINLNAITHVRVVDAVGSNQNPFINRDIFGRRVVDPWPTPFPSSGFDFDAVGVVWQADGNGILDNEVRQHRLAPNPVAPGMAFAIEGLQPNTHLACYDVFGREVAISTESLILHCPGVYFLRLQEAGKEHTLKLTVSQ